MGLKNDFDTAVTLRDKQKAIGDWCDIAFRMDRHKAIKFIKLSEEIGELADAMLRNDREDISDEFGDVLNVLLDLGHLLEVDAESSLKHAVHKMANKYWHLVQQQEDHEPLPPSDLAPDLSD